MADVKTGRLGETVTYVSSQGFQKAALVIGTPASVVHGTAIPELNANERHLYVISPTGTAYVRHNVPSGPFTTPAGDTVNTGVWFVAE